MYDTYINPRWSKEQIEESYRHVKPYMKHDEHLRTMCEDCPHFKKKDHNYDDCKGKLCLTFYLAYEYLEWFKSYD